MAETVKLEELVLDYTIYPREMVDRTNVRRLRDARAAGVILPPIIADRKSKRVVDGIHRYVQAREAGDLDIEVEWRDYVTEKDLLLDAMRLNSVHGKQLNPFEFARCITLGEKHRIKAEKVAKALGISLKRLQEIKASREARVIQPDGDKEPVNLKRTVSHLVGTDITEEQAEAAAKCGGMMAIYYVNQVINLVENDLIDQTDEALAERLCHLAKLLDRTLAVA